MKRTRHLPRTLGAMLGVIAVTAMTLVLPGLPGLATPAAAATSDRLIGEFRTYSGVSTKAWNAWPNTDPLERVANGPSGTEPTGGGLFTFPARGQTGPIVSQSTGLCLTNSTWNGAKVTFAVCTDSDFQRFHFAADGRILDRWDYGFTEGQYMGSGPWVPLASNLKSAHEVLVFDHLVPAVPKLTTPSDGSSINNTAPELSGTGSTSDTVLVKDQFGKIWCDTTVQPGGTWSCAAKPGSGVPDRSYILTVVSTTILTNTATSDPITLTIDTVPPPAPVLTGPADGAHINSPAPEFSGTGETGNTVTVTNPKDPNTALCSAPVTDGAWSCTSSVSYGEGNHTFTPTATDPAGNVTAGSSITVTLDLTPPVEPVITTPVDGSATKTTALDFAGTSEGGSAVSVTDQEGTAICAAKASSDGKWACSSETPFTDGDYVFTPTAKDRAGNAAAGAGVSVTIDTVAPEAPVITAPTAGTVTNATALPFAGTGENGSTVTVLGPDGGAVCTATVVDEAWACTADPELTEGEYAFTPVARDRAGNERTGTATAIRIDTTPPTTPVITAPEDGTFTNNVLPAISGTGETESAIVVRTEDGTEVCAATVVDGAWSCAPTAPLPEAEHALTAVSTDSAGNTATSAPVGVTVDLTVPSVPAITSPREGAF
ncbi:Ig-like domain-containing protein, partial [Leucobacter sp. PH1c]|uniref:Ig-like domain-containing protein n=1 Tax=Leucobacter sp. PH1c TaxID=1397278 RepID=UPI0018E2AC08